MSAFLITFVILNLVIGIWVLVYYIRNFKEANSFIKYGLVVMVIFIIINIMCVKLIGKVSPLMFIVYSIKTAIYTCIGMELCLKLGYKDMPLMRKAFHSSDGEDINMPNYILSIAGVIGGSALFTYILFKITSPKVSDILVRFTESNPNSNDVSTLALVAYSLSLVITEELTFRFITPNLIAKKFKLEGKKYWIAIIFSAMFWSVAHSGTLDPEWVKLVQIFPIGLALGWLFKNYGLESTIFAHAGFNILMTLLNNTLA